MRQRVDIIQLLNIEYAHLLHRLLLERDLQIVLGLTSQSLSLVPSSLRWSPVGMRVAANETSKNPTVTMAQASSRQRYAHTHGRGMNVSITRRKTSLKTTNITMPLAERCSSLPTFDAQLR